MKHTKAKIGIIALVILLTLAIVIAQRSQGNTIEKTSIGNAQNPLPPSTSERQEGNTRVVETTGEYPDAESIRDALRKGMQVGIGVVYYNYTPTPPPVGPSDEWRVGWAHMVRVVAINDTYPYSAGNWTRVLVYDPYTGTTVPTAINETIEPVPGSTEGKKVTWIFWWGVWALLEDQVSIKVVPSREPGRQSTVPNKPPEREQEFYEVAY